MMSSIVMMEDWRMQSIEIMVMMMVDNIINQEDGDDGEHNTCINCLSSMMTAAWFQSTTWNHFSSIT